MSERLVARSNAIVLLGEHNELALPSDEQASHLDLLSCLHCAALLLNEQGEVLSFNSRAKRLLGRGLKLSGSRIVATQRGSAELLAELIRAGISGVLQSNNVLLLGRSAAVLKLRRALSNWGRTERWRYTRVAKRP